MELREFLDYANDTASRGDHFHRRAAEQLIRYPVGGHYVWHQDAVVPSFRKVSVLVYLSDAASHEVAHELRVVDLDRHRCLQVARQKSGAWPAVTGS